MNTITLDRLNHNHSMHMSLYKPELVQ